MTYNGRWNSVLDQFKDMESVQREVNRFLQGIPGAVVVYPPVNVWANENEIVVTAEVPGVDPKGVTVTVEGKVLLIEGERVADPLQENETYHRQERVEGSFAREVELPYEVENDGVTAKSVHGVLEVHLPRAVKSKPTTIVVEAE